jgi:hypothetical protein
MNFRQFEITDTNSTVDLLNLCFSSQNITRESFLWKHFDEFFGGQTIAFVAEESDLIVGFVCFTPFEIIKNEKVANTWVCAVQACHPDFRRRGIVKELTIMCEKIIGNDKVYIGFSNTSGVKIDQNSKSINYQIVGQMQQTILLPNLAKTNLVIVSSIQDLKNFQSEIDPNLFLRSSSKNIIKIRHCAQFTKWRYTNNPKVKYY